MVAPREGCFRQDTFQYGFSEEGGGFYLVPHQGPHGVVGGDEAVDGVLDVCVSHPLEVAVVFHVVDSYILVILQSWGIFHGAFHETLKGREVSGGLQGEEAFPDGVGGS